MSAVGVTMFLMRTLLAALTLLVAACQADDVSLVDQVGEAICGYQEQCNPDFDASACAKVYHDAHRGFDQELADACFQALDHATCPKLPEECWRLF